MTPERRAKRDEAAAKRIIEKAYTIFREDEIKRCTNRAEVVAALRKLKTRLNLELTEKGHADWLEYTTAFIDEKIDVLTSDQPLQHKEVIEVKPSTALTKFIDKIRHKKLPPADQSFPE